MFHLNVPVVIYFDFNLHRDEYFMRLNMSYQMIKTIIHYLINQIELSHAIKFR